MIITTCDKCKEHYEYEIPRCPKCWNDTFDIEELSDCCSATLVWEYWLCSDCKEHCK